MSRFTLALLVLALVGAGCEPVPIVYRDGDGDGFGDASLSMEVDDAPSTWVEDATDCDDSDPFISPAAAERCVTVGVDDDCDGEVDEDSASDTLPWYLDEDGDSFGRADRIASACTLPEGYADRHGDCDDADPEVRPNAQEVCSDGIDNDCDGGQGDCGLVGEVDVDKADTRLLGEDGGDRAGVVAAAGDVDGDGYGDVLVGAWDAAGVSNMSGAAYLVRGPMRFRLGLMLADAFLPGSGDAGWSVAGGGDVDGDGLADVLVGAPRDGTNAIGSVRLYRGPLEGEVAPDEATAVLWGDYGVAQCGGAVAWVGDVDDDGLDDFAVGCAPTWGMSSDVAWLVTGAVEGSAVVDEVALALRSEGGSGVGCDLAGGDLDGDGVDDLVISDPGDDAYGSVTGAVWVVLGPVTTDLTLEDGSSRITGTASGGWAGIAVDVVPDVDGDGRDDWMASSPHIGAGGAAYLVHGPGPGSGDLTQAEATIFGGAGSTLGWDVAGIHDLDGDGRAELALGDPGYSQGGAVHVFFETPSGVVTSDAAEAVILGDEHEGLGWRVASAGDTNGDGIEDLLVGDPSNDELGGDAGAGHLFLGGAL